MFNSVFKNVVAAAIGGCHRIPWYYAQLRCDTALYNTMNNGITTKNITVCPWCRVADIRERSMPRISKGDIPYGQEGLGLVVKLFFTSCGKFQHCSKIMEHRHLDWRSRLVEEKVPIRDVLNDNPYYMNILCDNLGPDVYTYVSRKVDRDDAGQIATDRLDSTFIDGPPPVYVE